MNKLPLGFPTDSKDVFGRVIRLGDKITFVKAEPNEWFTVIFKANAFRKKYKGYSNFLPNVLEVNSDYLTKETWDGIKYDKNGISEKHCKV